MKKVPNLCLKVAKSNISLDLGLLKIMGDVRFVPKIIVPVGVFYLVGPISIPLLTLRGKINLYLTYPDLKFYNFQYS